MVHMRHTERPAIPTAASASGAHDARADRRAARG